MASDGDGAAAGGAFVPDFVGVYGWLEEKGRVLVVSTVRDLGAPGRQVCWELPGGKVEPGESPEEALRREIREETGLDVRVGERFFSFRGERLTNGARKYVWEGLFYEVHREGGELRPNGRETLSARMAPLAELTALFHAPYHAPIVRWLRSGRTLRTDDFTWDDAL